MRRSQKVRLVAVLNAAVLVVGLISAVAGPQEEPAPPAAELELRGTAELSGQGGRLVTSGGYELAIGEVVTMRSGEAVLALADAGSVELRAGKPGGEGSRVEVGKVPTLLAGDALVLAGGEQEQSMVAGGTSLSMTDGAAHVSRSMDTTLSVYRGRAEVAADGGHLPGGVPALRQVVVADTGTPATPQPLSFDPVGDPWDRRFLGDVIDLQSTLEAQSRGFSSSLQRDFVPDVFFYQAVLPGLLQQPAFDQTMLDDVSRPPGETLVGAAIALVGEGSTFADRWDQVFALRDAGAGWGVVAFDQRSERGPLLAALAGAFERSPLLFGPPSPVPIFRPALPPPAPPPRNALPANPSPVAVPPPVAPSPVPIARPSPAGTPPSPSPVPDGGQSLLEPVLDPVANLLGGVLDGLKGLTGGLL